MPHWPPLHPLTVVVPADWACLHLISHVAQTSSLPPLDLRSHLRFHSFQARHESVDFPVPNRITSKARSETGAILIVIYGLAVIVVIKKSSMGSVNSQIL